MDLPRVYNGSLRRVTAVVRARADSKSHEEVLGRCASLASKGSRPCKAVPAAEQHDLPDKRESSIIGSPGRGVSSRMHLASSPIGKCMQRKCSKKIKTTINKIFTKEINEIKRRTLNKCNEKKYRKHIMSARER